MPVNMNVNIQTKNTQALEKTKSAKINEGKQGGAQGGEEVAGEFKEKSKFSMKGANGSTGLTYTASADKKDDFDQKSVDTQIKAGKAAESKAKDSTSDARAQQKEGAADHKAFINDHKAAMGNIENETSNIDAQSNSIESATGRLNSITAKQDSIKAWIDNQSPTIEDMTLKMQELTDEAFAMIADAGITEEFGSLDEAMEAISQIIEDNGGEDAMKLMEEKTAERDALAEEVNGMPDDDPKKAEKQEELESLNAGLEPGGEFNPTTDLGLDLAALSELQANLGDTMAAIGELGANVEAYHETLDSKQGELDGLQNNAVSENNAIGNANKSIKTSASAAEQFVNDLDEPTAENTKQSNDMMTGGQITQTVGNSTMSIGGALIPNTPTTAVGIATMAAGGIAVGVGIGVSNAGQKQLEETNEKITEKNKQQQKDYNAQVKANEKAFYADQSDKLDKASAKKTNSTLAESRKKTAIPVGPSGGTEGA